MIRKNKKKSNIWDHEKQAFHNVLRTGKLSKMERADVRGDHEEVYGDTGIVRFRSEGELFDHLWNTRPHLSEVSGKPLLRKEHSLWHWQFAHVLPKSHYDRFRFNPKNIVLCLPDEHQYQDRATHDPAWSWFFLLKSFLKTQYFQHGKIQS